jgi:hypothetical protein
MESACAKATADKGLARRSFSEGGKAGSGQPYDGWRERGFAELERVAIPSLPVSERHAGFAEVELGCDPEQVTAEVRRCLQCDLEICLAQEKRAAEVGR